MKHLSPPGLVSVIVPTHNRARLIGEMLGSLGAQTHRPLEVIVSDDGSTDDTRAVVERLLAGLREREVSCQYLSNPKVNGNYARNRGLERAHGEHLLFIDSDDVAHPDLIARLLTALRSNGADFSVCDVGPFRDRVGDLSEVMRFSARPHTPEAHLRASVMTTCTLFTASAMHRIGPWNESLTKGQDKELTFRALVLGSGWLLQVSLLSAGALIAAYFTYKSNQFIARVRSAFGHAPTQQG